MTFGETQRTEMANIFNNAISNTEYSSFTVGKEDFKPNCDEDLKLIEWEETGKNPLPKIFNQDSPSRIDDEGQFFHFKSVNLAKNIISNQNIQVSNLLSNDENDYAEYSEFFKRLGLFNKFIPTDYCENRNPDGKSNNKYSPASPKEIDNDRDNIFILCFTKDSRNEYFWEEYAKKDTGVCLCFRFSNINPEKKNLYEFRDVSYDEGYRYDFLNHINYSFIKIFSCQILLNSMTKFARFYKRGKYKWENETRLVFSNIKLYKDDPLAIENLVEIHEDGNRKYIELPLFGNSINNPLFTLTIDEVICGKNVSLDDYLLLERSLEVNFPSARIWQRK